MLYNFAASPTGDAVSGFDVGKDSSNLFSFRTDDEGKREKGMVREAGSSVLVAFSL